MAKTRLYLAYGSNLSQEQMAHRCPAASVVGTAILRNWQLQFKTHATVTPAKGYNVPVLVWSLTPACEAALDMYEGYRPNHERMGYYHKQYVRIRVGDAKSYRKAMLYVMNPRPLQLPQRGYYNIIHDAYEELGFDMGILDTAIAECRRGVPARVVEETH